MQDFRKLNVWQKAHEIVLDVYRMSAAYPREEQLGLTSQTRRAAASVPTNMAEGCGRGTDADFRRFLLMANGSACEVDYLLLLARDLGYIDGPTHQMLAAKLDEVKRMLTSLIATVKAPQT